MMFRSVRSLEPGCYAVWRNEDCVMALLPVGSRGGNLSGGVDSSVACALTAGLAGDLYARPDVQLDDDERLMDGGNSS